MMEAKTEWRKMIFLFVGAGCSRVIDEEKFPTVVEGEDDAV